jgi:hypothetical protein
MSPEEAIAAEIKDYAERRLDGGDALEDILQDLFELTQDVLEGILANKVIAKEEDP